MKKLLLFFLITVFLTGGTLFLLNSLYHMVSFLQPHRWEVRSIDTMKTSRDLARAKAKDTSYDREIEKQISNIAQTGANYVAIGTPYDEEFIPYLKRWTTVARKYGLHVWFRGNFSGWDQFFGYPKIDEATHIAKTKAFILQHKELFEDGDIFTPCPECENGKHLQDSNFANLPEYRTFLITEYNDATNAFLQIGKKVTVGYYGMNADVARVVMDRETTKALGGVVVVDHYVRSPQRLANDLKALAEESGGKVVLGEFGAPIPDIHGKMNDGQQKEWINEVLNGISQVSEVIGVNYWVNTGGSTALWSDNGNPKPAVSVIKHFYSQN